MGQEYNMSSAMKDISLLPEMNFTFWWRLEGIAPAMWIQVRPRNRLKVVGCQRQQMEFQILKAQLRP